MKRSLNVLALACVGAFATSAMATINVTYDGTGIGQSSLGVTYAAGGDANDGQGRVHNGFNGSLLYTVNSVSGPFASYFSVGQSLSVFCTDFFDNANSGNYTFQDLSDAPQPGTYQMGEDRAALISGLYGAWHDNLATANEFAAFQLAIWEIAFEDEFDGTLGSLDLESGQFFSDGSIAGNAERGNILAIGHQMIEDAWQLYEDGEGLSLLAATSNNHQDFIVIIPLPAPVWMGLAGLVGVAALRRRRKA